DAEVLQFFEGVSEVIENIAWQQRLLGLIAVENCDLRCAPAQPCADSRRVVKREALTKQAGANSGENIAHSSGGHSRVACGVVAQRPTAFSHDRTTAFEQKCDRKTVAELRRCFGARLRLFWTKPFHLAWMWCEQSISFATPEHGVLFGHDIESIGVEHH